LSAKDERLEFSVFDSIAAAALQTRKRKNKIPLIWQGNQISPKIN
jgi:hypothetical protein